MLQQDGSIELMATVTQDVVHGDNEDPEVIMPEEAALMQDEAWATAVEARIAQDGLAAAHPTLLLLTFSRCTRKLEDALLASPLAVAAIESGHVVKPAWAKG